MSADSDDTSLPELPPVSALGKDVQAKLEALSAGTTAARTARTKRRAEKRSAKREKQLEVASKTKEAAKLLASIHRSQDLDYQTKIIDSIAIRGLEHAHGLLLKPGEEGYNPDADVPMPDATTRTHFGMKVYQQMMANKREGMATARALGVVLVQGLKSESEWNEEARRVDEEQRLRQAIDVAQEMLKDNDGT